MNNLLKIISKIFLNKKGYSYNNNNSLLSDLSSTNTGAGFIFSIFNNENLGPFVR